MSKPITKLPPEQRFLIGEFSKFQDAHERANSSYEMVRNMNYFIEEARDQGLKTLKEEKEAREERGEGTHA